MAQPLHVKTYTTADGLPSLECYNKMDLGEETYIVSNNHVSKWNGYRWNHIRKDSIGIKYGYHPQKIAQGIYHIVNGTESSLIYDNGKWIRVKQPEGMVQASAVVKDNVYAFHPSGVVWRLNLDNYKFEVHDSIQLNIDSSLRFDSFGIDQDSTYIRYRYRDTQERRYRTFIEYFNADEVIDSRYKIILSMGKNTLLVDRGTSEISYSDQYEKKSTYYLPEISNFQKRNTRYGRLQDQNGGWIALSSKVNVTKFIRLQSDTIYEIGQIPFYRGYTEWSTLQNGGIWMSSGEGLRRINPHQLYFSSTDEKMIPSLNVIVEDSFGEIIFGSYQSKVATYKYGAEKTRSLGTIARFLPGATLHTDGNIYSFIEERSQILSYNNREWKKLQLKWNGNTTRTKGYIIRTLNDGRLGLGLQRGGFGLVTAITDEYIDCKPIGAEKGMTIPDVWGFTQDQSGRIWMGGRGIAIYDMEKDTAVTYERSADVSESLASKSYLCDGQGTMWIGTHKGL
ncbi:MAG: hypothetical protein ACJA01_004013 [Saprospiraceae bacterium]|jgi:hypothetical protein